jgi:hypothetical protein
LGSDANLAHGNEVSTNEPKRPTVFISSTFRDDFDGIRWPVPLRRRIIENKSKFPAFIWVYEHFWRQGEEPLDADTIIDRCFSGIRDSDLFVFLLTGRHGSGASYFEDRTFASYLELELFAASMLRKPVLVLHERGHEPDERLRDTMLLLHRAFKSGGYLLDDEDGLYRELHRACVQLAAGTLELGKNPIVHLPEWLSIRRCRTSLGEDLEDPKLAFLDGVLKADKASTDPAKAERLLAQVSSGVRIKGGNEGPLPHGSALFRVWAAMRELMDMKGTTLSDPATAILWDRAFGLWASKASWFGLHGHVWMGPLAAINSQTGLRETFATSPEYRAASDVREPLGARASAIYSIAQRMDTRSRKRRHYREVIVLATRAMERDQDAQQGVLSIRGHALMRTAFLGEVWKLLEAAEDFKRCYDIRIRMGASPASVGEALCDFGFARIFTGHVPSGLAMMQEGIDLMRTDTSVNGKAFLARALRKLETAAKFTLSLDLIRRVREERLAIADQTEALDQARKA